MVRLTDAPMGKLDFIKRHINRYRDPIPLYRPQIIPDDRRSIDVPSAWKGIEAIIPNVIQDFSLNTQRCLEFGVEYGYSAVALSNYFEQVIGVDTFLGDRHTRDQGDHYDQTRKALSAFPGITLIKADYLSWIENDTGRYDLIHVDIVHTYEDTFRCGLWSALHSDCAIFHDTEKHAPVRRAVIDIAREINKKIVNYPYCNGLGIVF